MKKVGFSFLDISGTVVSNVYMTDDMPTPKNNAIINLLFVTVCVAMVVLLFSF
jgi:hypothetical protein